MNESKKAVFLSWEKLRIGYNLILLVEALLVLGKLFSFICKEYWHLAVLLAVTANVLYLIGPLSEMGVRKLVGLRAGRISDPPRLRGLRWLLFSVGMVFAMWVIWDIGHIVVLESQSYYEPGV